MFLLFLRIAFFFYFAFFRCSEKYILQSDTFSIGNSTYIAWQTLRDLHDQKRRSEQSNGGKKCENAVIKIRFDCSR